MARKKVKSEVDKVQFYSLEATKIDFNKIEIELTDNFKGTKFTLDYSIKEMESKYSIVEIVVGFSFEPRAMAEGKILYELMIGSESQLNKDEVLEAINNYKYQIAYTSSFITSFMLNQFYSGKVLVPAPVFDDDNTSK